MKTNHTPGPWELDYDKGSTQDILSRRHGGICTVRRAGRHDNATFAANARLIAAAPAMFDLLTAADRLEELTGENLAVYARTFAALARAAIARATGGNAS